MAFTRTPRARWVDEGLRALADGGPDAVRVEALAKEIGVSKGGFYWHFADRKTLLDEALDAWERMVVDKVIEGLEDEGGDAESKLRRLFAMALTSDRLRKTELAIRDWARREPTVARRVRRIDNRRMEYMRSLFGELCPDEDQVEVRCFIIMALFVGSPFVAADHGGRSRADVVALALEWVLDLG